MRTLVITPVSNIESRVRQVVEEFHPRLFCLRAVSTRFPAIREVARCVNAIDPSITVVLGGHHASLNQDVAISEEAIDPICVGEGERPIGEFHPATVEWPLPVRSAEFLDYVTRRSWYREEPGRPVPERS